MLRQIPLPGFLAYLEGLRDNSLTTPEDAAKYQDFIDQINAANSASEPVKTAGLEEEWQMQID